MQKPINEGDVARGSGPVMNSSFKNVFIVGEQRSGSNLLRLMLDQSGALSCPHPPHFLQRLMPFEAAYNQLPPSRRLVWMATDMLELAKANPIPWQDFEPSPIEIASAAAKNSLAGVYLALMNNLARNRNAEGWVCKSVQNIRWIDEILNAAPQASFIYLTRDPRDVTASFKKAVVGNKHPYFIAKQWHELNALCLNAAKRLPEKFHFLKYEDLVADPLGSLKSVCAFIGIRFSPAMLQFHKSTEAQVASRKSQLWKNLNKSIFSRPNRAYRQSLPEEEIKLVERVSQKGIHNSQKKLDKEQNIADN